MIVKPIPWCPSYLKRNFTEKGLKSLKGNKNGHLFKLRPMRAGFEHLTRDDERGRVAVEPHPFSYDESGAFWRFKWLLKFKCKQLSYGCVHSPLCFGIGRLLSMTTCSTNMQQLNIFLFELSYPPMQSSPGTQNPIWIELIALIGQDWFEEF